MPSEKILSVKQAKVAELREKISSSVAGVLVDYKGISVLDDTKLRSELREAGVEYCVIKNTLIKLAIKDTNVEGMSNVLEGNTALAISKEDPIIAAKIIDKYVDVTKGKLNIKAGYMEGASMDAAAVTVLAKLPSREGLLSMLLSAITGNVRGLAVALNAIAEKNTEVA